MVRAFILMIVRPGSEIKLSDRIKKMKNVEDVDVVYGEYDLIVKVKAASMAELQTIARKLRTLKDVEQTSTMVALK